MALETRKKHMLVNPITEPSVASFAGVPRLVDLRGKRLGLVDDSKTNAKELLEDLTDLLKSKYGVADVMYHRKPSASKPADPEALARMAKECDYAIVAIGD